MKKVAVYGVLLLSILTLVSCGKIVENTQVNVVDPKTKITNEVVEEEMSDDVDALVQEIVEPILNEIEVDEKNKTEENKTEEVSVANKAEVEASAEPLDAEASQTWSYVEYSEERVANAKGNIVLFFHADWCSACLAFEKKVKSEVIPSDITILEVNYDTATDLKSKYWITAQTSFVHIDNTGNEIKKWVGWRGIESVIEKVQ